MVQVTSYVLNKSIDNNYTTDPYITPLSNKYVNINQQVLIIKQMSQ